MMRVLTTVAFLLAVAPRAYADVFTLSAAPDPVTVGTDVIVSVAGDVSDLLSLALNPVVDTAHLSLVSFLPGAALPGASDPNDTVTAGLGTTTPLLLFSGSAPTTGVNVTIATFVFDTIATGTATIDFTDIPPGDEGMCLYSCYYHNDPNNPSPTDITGSVSFLINPASGTPIPAPGSAVWMIGIATLAFLAKRNRKAA
jgi:hypothetical protein